MTEKDYLDVVRSLNFKNIYKEQYRNSIFTEHHNSYYVGNTIPNILHNDYILHNDSGEDEDTEFVPLLKAQNYHKDYPLSIDDVLIKSWIVGGLEGGNYKRKAREFIRAEIEPSFEELLTLVLTIEPKITLIKYLDICKDIKTFEYEDEEYYGNYEDRKIKLIYLKDIFNKINME